MIGALAGTVKHRSGDDLVIDVSGVGYQVCVSNNLKFKVSLGEEVDLHIFTDIKENAISLFGFERAEEKEVFLLLKKVKGVGSRLALGILDGAGASGVLAAIGRRDVTELCKIPGIGKKTAERILVELGEKVSEFASEPVSTQVVSEVGVEADVYQALVKLGFSGDKAKAAISSSIEQLGAVPKLDSGELLKEALSSL